MARIVSTLNKNRTKLIYELANIPDIGAIKGGNHANFVVAQICRDGAPDNKRALEAYKAMAENKGVVVRFRGNEVGCEGCLRITVGTEEEVTESVRVLKEMLA